MNSAHLPAPVYVTYEMLLLQRRHPLITSPSRNQRQHHAIAAISTDAAAALPGCRKYTRTHADAPSHNDYTPRKHDTSDDTPTHCRCFPRIRAAQCSCYDVIESYWYIFMFMQFSRAVNTIVNRIFTTTLSPRTMILRSFMNKLIVSQFSSRSNFLWCTLYFKQAPKYDSFNKDIKGGLVDKQLALNAR